MWLLHSLLILFLINQLIIIIHAHLAIRRTHLWLPDHLTEDLLPEAKSYWEQQHPAKSSNSRSTSQPPWFFNAFRSRQKSPSVPHQTQAPLEIDPHQLTISYFSKRLQPKTLSPEEKRKIIGKTLRYILDRPSMPTEQKLEWYKEILNKFDNYAVIGALATIDHILYAFHTLYLQSLKNEHLSRMTKLYLEQFKVKIGQTGIPLAGQWSQEIHYPERGLSGKFLDWDSLFTALLYHPELKQMVLAKNNDSVDFITKNLEQLYQIQLFSASPKIFLSAQSRVASIALLHHLLDMRFPEITKKVKAIIKSLINDQEDKYFLFEHERTLIGNLDREQSAKPTEATTSS